jgi:hypothetical protein
VGQRRERTSIIAASQNRRLVSPLVFQGSCNTAVVDVHFEKVLLPALPPGSVIVLDNARFHQSPTTAALVAAAGCRLLFLPAYSPDRNPHRTPLVQLQDPPPQRPPHRRQPLPFLSPMRLNVIVNFYKAAAPANVRPSVSKKRNKIKDENNEMRAKRGFVSQILEIREALTDTDKRDDLLNDFDAKITLRVELSIGRTSDSFQIACDAATGQPVHGCYYFVNWSFRREWSLSADELSVVCAAYAMRGVFMVFSQCIAHAVVFGRVSPTRP